MLQSPTHGGSTNARARRGKSFLYVFFPEINCTARTTFLGFQPALLCAVAATVLLLCFPWLDIQYGIVDGDCHKAIFIKVFHNCTVECLLV